MALFYGKVYYFRVTVIDVNDNAPKMDIPQGCVSISEFHDLHDVIYVIKAKDADDPTTPNGRVKMRITSGNELGAFNFPMISSTFKPNTRRY